MNNQYLKSIMENVTKSIGSGHSLDDKTAELINQAVIKKVSEMIPNAMPKAASQAIGSIYDPESGYHFEANTGETMSGVNSLGIPIMNGDLFRKIEFPNPNDPEAVKFSKEVKAQDKDWEEDMYTSYWLPKYQEAKALRIKTMLNSYSPMKEAFITGLPYNVVSKYNPVAAALITSKDYALLQVNNNLVATLGLGQTTLPFQGAFQSVSAPNMVAKYWKFNNDDLKIEKGVPEGKIIETVKSEIAEVKYTIGKNAGAVGATWESSLVVTQGDPYGMINGRIGNLLSNARSEMLIDEMEANAVATGTGADMGDITGDRNTNDPTDFLQPVIDAMRKLKNTFDNPISNVSIFSGSKAFTKFLNSTFTKGWFQPNGRMVLTGEVSTAGAFLPISSTWYTTDLITQTLLYLIDPRAIPAFTGPTQRSEWFDGRNLSRATYYFDAFGTHTVAPELTAVFQDVVTI